MTGGNSVENKGMETFKNYLPSALDYPRACLS